MENTTNSDSLPDLEFTNMYLNNSNYGEEELLHAFKKSFSQLVQRSGSERIDDFIQSLRENYTGVFPSHIQLDIRDSIIYQIITIGFEAGRNTIEALNLTEVVTQLMIKFNLMIDEPNSYILVSQCLAFGGFFTKNSVYIK